MLVFKTLMTYRVFGWSRESVDAVNIIEVVFADDKGVREAWKSLYDKLNVSHIDQQQLSKIEMAKFRLLEEMAKALGYKNKITWETIQNPYVPVGLLKQMQSQEEYSQGMISALGQLNSMLSKTPEDVTVREDASDG